MSSGRRTRPRAVRGILRASRETLGTIAERARTLGHLQRRLQGSLPARLRGHWQLAAVDADALVVVADGPAWASQLRYHQRALLDAAGRATGRRPARCRITVEPPRLAPRREPRRLSAVAGRSLRETAQCVEDERLRRALLRLATRAQDDH